LNGISVPIPSISQILESPNSAANTGCSDSVSIFEVHHFPTVLAPSEPIPHFAFESLELVCNALAFQSKVSVTENVITVIDISHLAQESYLADLTAT
jgi:hypothetical protein